MLIKWGCKRSCMKWMDGIMCEMDIMGEMDSWMAGCVTTIMMDKLIIVHDIRGVSIEDKQSQMDDR
jgi:hypothetical protein